MEHRDDKNLIPIFEGEISEQDLKKLLGSLGDVGITAVEVVFTEEYNGIFYNQEIQKSLVEICSGVADYVYDENINNIAIVDRAARPAYLGIREAWRRKYPDESPLNLNFINPTGFVDIKTGLSWDHEHKAPKAFARKKIGDRKLNETGGFLTSARTKNAVIGDFANTYSQLMESKDQPLLILDTCIHSGNSIEPVLGTLDSLGFADVRLGVMNDEHNTSKIRPDVMFENDSPSPCYPFSIETMVDRTFGSVSSTKATHPMKIEEANLIRQELSAIFRQAPDDWFYDGQYSKLRS